MTPEQTIKYCLHGYHQDVRDKNLVDHPFTKQYHYGRVRAFLEVLEAVAQVAGITASQVKKIQKQVVRERHESGADRKAPGIITRSLDHPAVTNERKV